MSIDEVLGQAYGMITERGIRQDPQSRASDFPDRRSFRMYRNQGLIDAPAAKAGVAGVYGRYHVLQLVVIKHLQSARIPLRKIRERLASATEHDLEALLAEEATSVAFARENSSWTQEQTKTSQPARYIRIDLDPDVFVMLDEKALDRSRPSSFRALGDQLASRLLALRNETSP